MGGRCEPAHLALPLAGWLQLQAALDLRPEDAVLRDEIFVSPEELVLFVTCVRNVAGTMSRQRDQLIQIEITRSEGAKNC